MPNATLAHGCHCCFSIRLPLGSTGSQPPTADIAMLAGSEIPIRFEQLSYKMQTQMTYMYALAIAFGRYTLALAFSHAIVRRDPILMSHPVSACGAHSTPKERVCTFIDFACL